MQQAAQSMIISKAITLEADRMGLSVTDDELRDFRVEDRWASSFSRMSRFNASRHTSSSSRADWSYPFSKVEQAVKAEIAQQNLISAVGGAITSRPNRGITKELQTRTPGSSLITLS